MAVNDVYRLTIQGQAQENFVLNAFYFKIVTDPGLTPLATAYNLCLSVYTVLNSPWLECFASDYLQLGYQAKRVSNGGGPQAIYPTVGDQGSASGVTDFSIAGGLITSPYQDPTSMKYRRVRITLPGAPEGYVQQNRPTSTYTSAMQYVCNILSAAINGTGSSAVYRYCSWKRKNPLVDSVIIDLLTTVPSGHVGVMRKRERPEV